MASIKWQAGGPRQLTRQTLNPTPPTANETRSSRFAIGGPAGARRMDFDADSSAATAATALSVSADTWLHVVFVDYFQVVPDAPGERPPGAHCQILVVGLADLDTRDDFTVNVFPNGLRWPFITTTWSRTIAGVSLAGESVLAQSTPQGLVKLATTGEVEPSLIARGRDVYAGQFVAQAGYSPVVQLAFGTTYALVAAVTVNTAASAAAVVAGNAPATQASAKLDGSSKPRLGGFPRVFLTDPPILPPPAPPGVGDGAGSAENGDGEADSSGD